MTLLVVLRVCDESLAPIAHPRKTLMNSRVVINNNKLQ